MKSGMRPRCVDTDAPGGGEGRYFRGSGEAVKKSLEQGPALGAWGGLIVGERDGRRRFITRSVMTTFSYSFKTGELKIEIDELLIPLIP